MATDDANPYWADPARRAQFFDLDPETGRHRRFFDIDHLAGVRQEDPEVFAATHALALAARARGAGRRAADRPSRRARRPGRLPRAAARRRRRARLGGEDPRPRRAAARLAGRGHGRLRVPQRRLRRCSSIPAGEAALTALWDGAGRRRAPVRGVGGRGEASSRRARRSRPTSTGCGATVARASSGLEEALAALPGLPHLHPRPAGAARTCSVLREAGLVEWLGAGAAGRSSRASSRRRRRSWPRASRTRRSTATCGCSR